MSEPIDSRVVGYPYLIALRQSGFSSDRNASKRELMKVLQERRAEASPMLKAKRRKPASGFGNPGEHARIGLAHFSAGRRNHDWLWRCDDALEFAAVAHNDDVVHHGKGKPRNVERKGARAIGADGVGALEGAVGGQV